MHAAGGWTGHPPPHASRRRECPRGRRPDNARPQDTGWPATISSGRFTAGAVMRLRNPRKRRDHVVQIVPGDEAKEPQTNKEREKPEQERHPPDVRAVLVGIAHARLLAT